MKLIHYKKITRSLAVLGVSVSMFASQFASASATGFKIDGPVKKKNQKTKLLLSRNNNAVKIYPDIIKRDMHVVAKDNDGKEIDFFVFDMQGTLMKNYKMKAKDHNRMTDLDRGSYIYRVFCGDEETASGTFEIR